MICYRGPTRLIIFEHNLKAPSLIGYLDLLVKDAKILYPNDDFRICLDNDSKHTSKDMADFVLENNLNIVKDWPSSSPDLNPIENVWGRMSIELQKLSPQNADDLRKALKTLWRRLVTREYCESLINSMGNRLKQVIDREGQKTDYQLTLIVWYILFLKNQCRLL